MLLRSPGQSLMTQIEELTDEVNSDVFGLVMVPLMVFSIAAIQLYLGQLKPNPWIFGIYGIFTLVIMLALARKLHGHLSLRHDLYLGLEAELAVGQELNHLMRDGYYVYHDFPAENFNIDHVAVGPGGIFAIETKGRFKPDKGRGTYDATVTFDGKVLKFPEWEERKYLEQARRQAVWLKKWTSSAIGENAEARPVLALPGWFIDQKARGDVILYNGKNPRSWATAQGCKVLNESLIKRIKHQLEQRCRDVEPVAYRRKKKSGPASQA
jgi:Nuclease-related domain